MSSTRWQALDIVEEKESVSFAVAAGVIGTWDWHVRENKVYANERFASTFCVDPEAAKGGAPVEDFVAAIHPEDRAQVRQQIAAAVASGNQYAEEFRVVQEDGSVRWVLARGRCYKDADGQPTRFPGAAIDITDRKEREEIDRLLAAELQHRFRNLLAMVQSIAACTLTDEATIATARESFLQRIAAIGQALSVITDRSHQAADAASLVRTAAAASGDLSRFEISGEPLMIGASPALALSLAIHELTTNAIKYGALSSPAGRISIAWSIAHPTGTFTLEWTEAGGPPVAMPTRRGFGSFLLERNVAAEFGGSVSLAYDPTGLVWRLTAPISKLR
jgi:PAS domain S-box-containing protein